MKARYLIDKSALARMPVAAVRTRLAPIIEAGEAATCAIVDLEVLFSAPNHDEHERIRRRRALAYESVRSPSRFSNARSKFKPSSPARAATAFPFPISSSRLPLKPPA
jgi:predicted nucleic acid-binding protein